MMDNPTRLYTCWKSMRRRVNRLSIDRPVKDLHYIGLTICNEWDDFEVFKQWALSHGYNDNLTLDRIKNHLGYSPNNCQWVTQAEQTRNRRSYGKSKFRGVHFNQGRWRASMAYRPKHIGYFDTELEAALAYDVKAFQLLGDKANLNFPERYNNVAKH